MTVVTIHKAKTELSKLIARAEAGEEIILARGSKPVARLVPMQDVKPEIRGAGSFSHLLGKIPDSFFLDPLPEDEIDAWEGRYSFDNEK